MNKYIALIICCCICATTVLGQHLSMQDFKQIAEQVKQMKRYSYQTDVQATFPDGTKDSWKNTLYMDIDQQLLAYTNNTQQVVLNQSWFYKVDHTQKYVSVFDLERYKERYKGVLGDVRDIFKSNAVATFMDSVLVQRGQIRKAMRIGDVSTYDFTFPPGSYCQTMQLIFNHATGLPVSINMTTFAPEPYGDDPNAGTTCVIRCHHYTKEFAEDHFSIAGLFRITNGKVSLLQYKGYKLSSIL